MQIPSIPDYYSIMFSGCTQRLSDEYEDGRLYCTGLEYRLITIPIMAIFDFIVRKDWGLMESFPLINKLQHLAVESDIDYYSFISLN